MSKPLYIRFHKGKVAKTEVVSDKLPMILVDKNKAGKILGVEILANEFQVELGSSAESDVVDPIDRAQLLKNLG